MDRFQNFPQEGPNANDAPLPTSRRRRPSGAIFSGPRSSFPQISRPYNFQPCMNPEFISPMSPGGHEPSGNTNAAMSINPRQLLDHSSQVEYLTGPSYVQPNATDPSRGYQGYQMMTPPGYVGPMQPIFNGAESSYFGSGSQIPIIVDDEGQMDIPISGTDLSFPVQSPIPPAFLNNPPGPTPSEQLSAWNGHTDGPSGSTVDADGLRPPTFQVPSMEGASSPGSYSNFINVNPLVNAAHNLLKGKVASAPIVNPLVNAAQNMLKGRVASPPIVQASTARRRNPATLVCEYCQATFTRSHNLGYHKDAHFGIKNHKSLCGKAFVTPNSSKRHETTCPECKRVQK